MDHFDALMTTLMYGVEHIFFDLGFYGVCLVDLAPGCACCSETSMPASSHSANQRAKFSKHHGPMPNQLTVDRPGVMTPAFSTHGKTRIPVPS